ncbi:MAG: FAD-dependent thymidylate synthase, partial [Paraclostridium sp.]
KLVASGKNENEARRMAEKAAIEDARYVFPNACETKMVVTMNARTLYNFFSHRCCDRSQWEIQKLAEFMYDEVKLVAPATFSMAGPSCVIGNCPEGKMSCGKMLEKRLMYSQK